MLTFIYHVNMLILLYNIILNNLLAFNLFFLNKTLISNN